MCNDIHTEQRQRVDMFHTQESKLRQDEIRSVHEVCVGGKVMIDIGKVRSIIDERTKIGTISRDYGHHVDDELIITNAYELTLIDNAINELERLQEKEKPMKPNLISHDNRMTSFVDYQCPKCNIIVSQKIRLISVCIKDDVVKMEHCPHCGQRLDWSETE